MEAFLKAFFIMWLVVVTVQLLGYLLTDAWQDAQSDDNDRDDI